MSLLSDTSFSYLDCTKMAHTFSVWYAVTYHAQINKSEVVVPFGHPIIMQLILHVLWKDNYAPYLPHDRNIDVIVAFAGTVIHWGLQNHSHAIIAQNEFSTCKHIPTHTQLVQHISHLQGSELERYNQLTADICACGDEMAGLTQ